MSSDVDDSAAARIRNIKTSLDKQRNQIQNLKNYNSQHRTRRQVPGIPKKSEYPPKLYNDDDSDNDDFDDSNNRDRLEAQLREARRHNKELKKENRRLEYENNKREEDRLLRELKSSRNGSSYRGQQVTRTSPRASSEKQPNKIADVMEMMMIQNTQVQNMIMNQMMLKTLASTNAAPPPQPSLQPPPWWFEQQPPRSKGMNIPEGFHKKDTRAIQKAYPFPGTTGQKMLRNLSYCAFFCALLNRITHANKFRPNMAHMMKIKLLEIVKNLHQIYLAADGLIYQLLAKHILAPRPNGYSDLLRPPNQIPAELQKGMISELGDFIESFTFQITTIMPTTGVLGTNRKSAIFEMVKSGTEFPSGYFFDCELALIQLSADNKTVNMTDSGAMMLIINVFFIKALVKLFKKPNEYALLPNGDPYGTVRSNIKVIATIYVYIYRTILRKMTPPPTPKNQPPGKDKQPPTNNPQPSKKSTAPLPPMPQQLADITFYDLEIEPLIKQMKKSVEYAEQIIYKWASGYIEKLRAAAQ